MSGANQVDDSGRVIDLSVAFEAGVRGDLTRLMDFQQAVSHETGTENGPLKQAVQAAAWVLGAWPADAPTIAAWRPGSARAIGVFYARMGLVAACCQHDEAAVGAWREFSRSFLDAADDNAADDVAGLWLALLQGDLADVEQRAAACAEKARLQGRGALVAESAVLRALGAVQGGQPTAADLARRAALMAQAERAPLEQHLAALVLARVRRMQGRPHLALHILSALTPTAPRILHGWLAGELLLSGGTAPARTLLDKGTRSELDPSRRCGVALLDLVSAAHTGDRAAFVMASASLRVSGIRAWQDEAHSAPALLSVLAQPEPGATLDWRLGLTDEVPLGLCGLGASADDESTLVFVIARPGDHGCRVLAAGLALVPDVFVLRAKPGDDAGVRTDAGLATLAIAGPPGLMVDEFFGRVYGFTYQAAIHRGALNTLVLRMRSRIDKIATIHRNDDPAARIALQIHEPVAIPDPRTTTPASDRILQALVRLGATGAQDAATALGVPLRTVQLALQRLVADGTVGVTHEGRRVIYSVEDTIFSVITSGGPRLLSGGDET